MSGSGISWTICKSAPRSRQITTPAHQHSVFTGQMPFLPPNQQRQSTEGMFCVHNITNKNVTLAKAKPSSIQAMHKCFIKESIFNYAENVYSVLPLVPKQTASCKGPQCCTKILQFNCCIKHVESVTISQCYIVNHRACWIQQISLS